jgi:hypothetical protein
MLLMGEVTLGSTVVKPALTAPRGAKALTAALSAWLLGWLNWFCHFAIIVTRHGNCFAS